jgi:hypothetical protein
MAGYGMDFGVGSGLAGIGSGLWGMFNNRKSPMDAANPYISQIPGQTSKYFDPYSEAGQRSIKPWEEEYNNLIKDPGGKYNKIGESFHQSPGFKFAMEQALQGGNHAAAAGGMAGSPQHEQQNMQLANDLANQDYYKYMQGATDLYGKGLTGGENMMNRGMNAGKNQADMIAQMLATQGNMAYEGQKGKNEGFGNALSSLLGGAFSFL